MLGIVSLYIYHFSFRSFDNTGKIWIQGESHRCKSGENYSIGDTITIDYYKDCNKVLFFKNDKLEGEYLLKDENYDFAYFAVSLCQKNIGV